MGAKQREPFGPEPVASRPCILRGQHRHWDPETGEDVRTCAVELVEEPVGDDGVVRHVHRRVPGSGEAMETFGAVGWDPVLNAGVVCTDGVTRHLHDVHPVGVHWDEFVAWLDRDGRPDWMGDLVDDAERARRFNA